ncbi:gamma-glutamyltransferase [Pararhodobacter sp. SW119]|uniref:gamma-glutamyltransferase n=1 Tax=Pararhodobacter sp. SW119 TaxID=2780075 RepID=UPI001FD7E89A|nr:gamma-glutamyltransferase [Pararhodobacter sp. SW119]
MRRLVRSALFTAAAVAAASGPVLGQTAATLEQALPEATQALAARESVEAREFMVAAAHPLAVEVGHDILARGGSAADAAVAVQAMLTLVEPQSSGLGGGGFLLYWNAATESLTTFDARERAPAAADEGYWLDAEGEPLSFWDAVVGGRSVGVPGTPKLLEVLHARHGRLPWADLIDPAIAQAEEGFEVSPRLAGAIADAQERGLDTFDATRDYFFDAEGAPLAEGTLLRNPDLARTLRLYADQGAAPFYEGAIARDIVAAVRTDTNPGILELEDLASYEVIERAPVCVEYRAHEVCGMGPPSSGALTVGQILGMLEGFDLREIGPGAEAAHLLLEAGRLAFADRALYMADADFVSMPEGLLDRDYLRDRAALIDPETSMGQAEAGDPPWEDAHLRAPDSERPRRGTTHFVIVDRYGDMVSATTTIESGFGSRVMTGGFLLNNELTDFSFRPEADGQPIANRVEGGKRPRSSMSPTVVLRDGRPAVLVGSPGGAAIIGYTAAAIIAILDWQMDPQAAIDRPNMVTLNGPSIIEDTAEGAELAEALAAMGHEVSLRDLNSGLHVIVVAEDRLISAADIRREGAVRGQ